MKRKCDNADGQEFLRKKAAVHCILHVSGIQHGDFTPLNNVKGSATEKLSYLHDIRHRRLMEPRDSPHRMEDICNQIPDTLAGVNLEVIGYHRGCYQKFTKNQDRLKCSTTPSESATTTRSPRKASSLSAMRLFSPECIFCEKLEVKIHGKNRAMHQVSNV